jgi:hypothetical protein
MKRLFLTFALLSLFGLSNFVNSQTMSVNVQPISSLPVIGENPVVAYKTINNKIYLFGMQFPPFDNSIYNLSNKISTYDLITNTWDSLSFNLPYGIFSNNTAAYFNNHFYLAPGFSSGGSGGFGSHDKMIDVNLSNNTAQETSYQFSGGPIWNFSSIEANGKIYFLGGWNGSAVNSIVEFNPTSNTFQQVASFNNDRNYIKGILGNDGWIYTFSYSNIIERFNPVTYQIQTMSATLPVNGLLNYWHISQDSSIYFFDNWTVNPTIYKYNYSTDIVSSTAIVLNGHFSSGCILDSNNPRIIYGFKYNPDNSAPLQLVKITLTFPASVPLTIPEQTVNIYPNPANDNIEIEGLQDGKIEIMNIEGQVIKKIDVSDTKIKIDISKLPGGVYTISIITNDRIIIKKLVKE